MALRSCRRSLALSALPVFVLFVVTSVTSSVHAEANENSAGSAWDLKALSKPPRYEVVHERGRTSFLFYEGPSYEGASTRVYAIYSKPKDVDKPGPAMLLLHGKGGRAFLEWADHWSRIDVAALAIDLNGQGPRGRPIPDGGPVDSSAMTFDAVKQGVETTWPHAAVARAILGVSLLSSLPEVDPTKIGVAGIEWGASFACILAAIEPRVKVAAAVYGGAYLHEHVAKEPLAALEKQQRELWIKTFDPSSYLPRVKLPMIFVNGTNDPFGRLDLFQRSWSLTQGPRQLAVRQGMGHGHRHGWSTKEIHMFVKSVLIDGQKLPRLGEIKRDGMIVSAAVDGETQIVEARLHYTLDQGAWEKRQWKLRFALIDENGIRATLPQTEGITYFLRLNDSRGALVSTGYQEIP